MFTGIQIDFSFYPEIPTKGHEVLLKPRIGNIGHSDSFPCTGIIYADSAIIKNFTIPFLPPGEVYDVQQVYWTPSEEGDHEITVVADALDEVHEQDEGNNEYTCTMNVRREDTNPPEVSISYTPPRVTEMDRVTFYIGVTDESGVQYIELMIYTEKSGISIDEFFS